MRYMVLLFMAALYGLPAISQEKKASADSTFDNWYYVSREKLYQRLKGVKYDIIFFGNSITENGPWQELVGRKYKVGNRGIGGDNTFGMKARIADVALSKPKKIFLMMGINDIGRGLPASWILANYESIIQIIQKVSPKTRIYVQSVLPLNETVLKYDYLLNSEKAIRDLNTAIRNIAGKYGLVYVDVKEVLADEYMLKKEFTQDGIHVNTEAYIRWVQYLRDKKYL
ncbi:MAG: GDSL-type esterase/lipase family protein [Niabella sp.]